MIRTWTAAIHPNKKSEVSALLGEKKPIKIEGHFPKFWHSTKTRGNSFLSFHIHHISPISPLKICADCHINKAPSQGTRKESAKAIAPRRPLTWNLWSFKSCSCSPKACCCFLLVYFVESWNTSRLCICSYMIMSFTMWRVGTFIFHHLNTSGFYHGFTNLRSWPTSPHSCCCWSFESWIFLVGDIAVGHQMYIIYRSKSKFIPMNTYVCTYI